MVNGISSARTLVRSNIEVISVAGVILQQWQLCLQLLYSEYEPMPSRGCAHHLIVQPMEHLPRKSAGNTMGPISQWHHDPKMNLCHVSMCEVLVYANADCFCCIP
jgi:hypothetical protein